MSIKTANCCGVIPVLEWKSPFGGDTRGVWTLVCPLCARKEVSWIGEVALRRAWNFRVTGRRTKEQEADESSALDGAKERET